MNEIFLFWDNENDEPEILAEDGEFYCYGEDEVAIREGNEKSGRYWFRVEKITHITPLNSFDRFDIFDPKKNDWVPFGEADFALIRQVQKLAGVKDWRIVT